MTPELMYLLKANICIAVFYVFYKLICSGDTFFGWRRILLLSFLLISFINPLPDLQSWVKKQPVLKEMAINYVVVDRQLSQTTVILPSQETKRTVDVYQILTFIYFLGVIALGIRFIISLISLFRQAIRCHERIFNGIKIKCLPEKSTPFSFFGWIFIAPSALRNSRSKEILMHECTHARERHSFDIIFSEIITIICWMNPFAWLMKKEIRLNLEYLADYHVLITGSDPRQYQYQLLGLSTIDQSAGLCNNFNISYLKSRIIMMNKNELMDSNVLNTHSLFP